MGSPRKPHTTRRTIERHDPRRARVVRTKHHPAPKVVPDRDGPLHVELICIGREILRGSVRDENGPYLADRFTQDGALVHRITVVDDKDRAIESAVREALDRRPHLVVTTGGLGPAEDDRTLAAVGDALQLPLKPDPRARQMVEAAYERLRAARVIEKGGMTESREKPCSLPVGAEPIPNAAGIAPGVMIRLAGGAAVLCLPGGPEEMRSVLEAASPMLRELSPKRHRAVLEVEAPTADESSLEPLIRKLSMEYPMVWIKSYARGFKTNQKILVTIEASAATKEAADSAVEGAFQRLLALAAGVR